MWPAQSLSGRRGEAGEDDSPASRRSSVAAVPVSAPCASPVRRRVRKALSAPVVGERWRIRFPTRAGKFAALCEHRPLERRPQRQGGSGDAAHRRAPAPKRRTRKSRLASIPFADASTAVRAAARACEEPQKGARPPCTIGHLGNVGLRLGNEGTHLTESPLQEIPTALLPS